MRHSFIALLVVLTGLSWMSPSARAQTYGIELQNSMMPAAGGMAGTSVARPQDLLSAINGNPATLTQFLGTQFTFGGGWAEPTINIDQTAPLPLVGVTPYEARSGQPGTPMGNIGVTQDFGAFGLPATLGIGLITNAGLGVDYRGIPASNGTSAQYLALDMISGAGVDMTERLSLGAALGMGISYIDGPFTDLGGMVPDYALRGTVGANYLLTDTTTMGTYWQTRKDFNFEDAVVFPGGTAYDLHFSHPENVGMGIANNSLADGRLLLAMDVLFKMYSDTDFLGAIYNDQWVYQFGAQYAVNRRVRLRLGYAYNENPMRQDPVVTSIGGVPLPDGIPGLRYVQGQFAAISQHRLTGGVGVRDVLPGLDFDVFAGGMFGNTDQFATTTATVKSYWVGAGFTWRFGRGACEQLPIPDDWGSAACQN